MPKDTIPTLATVASDAKARKKARGMLASLTALLGLGAAKPTAKMSKRTLTTKRVEMEETDESSAAEEGEEESEASSVSSTEKSSEASSAEEEEEERGEAEEEEEEESVPSKPEKEERHAKKGEAEEEEEALVSRAWTAAEKAYAKVAAKVDPYGIRGPKGMRKAARRATGAKTRGEAISALHNLRHKAATADAAVIQRIAAVEAKASKIETASRKDRVEAMVSEAKAEGRAPTKALRAQLREHGNTHGTKALAKLIASLPKLATNARMPKIGSDGSVSGAPAADTQALLKAMFGDLPEEQRKAAIADFETKMRMNGAGKAEA